MSTWNRLAVQIGERLRTKKGQETQWTVVGQPSMKHNGQGNHSGLHADLQCACGKVQSSVRISAVIGGKSFKCSGCQKLERRRQIQKRWPAIGEILGGRIVLSVYFATDNSWIKSKCINCGDVSDQLLETLKAAVGKGRQSVCKSCWPQRMCLPDTLGRYLMFIWKKKMPTFSISQFEFIGSLSCFYCGWAPENRIRTQRTASVNVELFYQGVDEVVYGLGHIIGNVLPCCITCNKAKNNHTLKDFCRWYNRRKTRRYHLTPEKIISAAAQLGAQLKAL